jgi:hypothetical protein
VRLKSAKKAKLGSILTLEDQSAISSNTFPITRTGATKQYKHYIFRGEALSMEEISQYHTLPELE